MNPNGVKVTGERLTQNSRPGFFLGYGEALTRALARVDRLPLYDIYEPKSQKSRRIFKFLHFRTKRAISPRKFKKIRHFSTFFATGRRLPLYDIYEVESQISRRENKKGYQISRIATGS